MVTFSETHSQKDARVNGTLHEHQCILSELTEQITSANVRTQASFDELKLMSAHNHACLEDLKLSMASFATKKHDSVNVDGEISQSIDRGCSDC